MAISTFIDPALFSERHGYGGSQLELFPEYELEMLRHRCLQDYARRYHPDQQVPLHDYASAYYPVTTNGVPTMTKALHSMPHMTTIRRVRKELSVQVLHCTLEEVQKDPYEEMILDGTTAATYDYLTRLSKVQHRSEAEYRDMKRMIDPEVLADIVLDCAKDGMHDIKFTVVAHPERTTRAFIASAKSSDRELLMECSADNARDALLRLRSYFAIIEASRSITGQAGEPQR